MADSSARRVALMSIKPEYAEKLLSGAKRVEFRRAGPKGPVELILIYATQPIGALVGVLEVTRVDRGSPDELWRNFGSVGGIEHSAFFSYFSGASAGDALVVGQAWRLNVPVRLESAGLDARPPQSFRYVDDDVLGTLGMTRALRGKSPRRRRAPRRAMSTS
jgi:predicted transcriptional regulator